MTVKSRKVGPAPQLKTVKITATIPDYDDPAQGFVEVDLEAGSLHLSEYDRIRVERHWPKATDGPSFWLVWLAWYVLHVEKAIPADVKFEQFRKDCVECRDTEPAEPVDPTTPTSEPMS